VCDLETSRIGAPYIYDISSLRVKHLAPKDDTVKVQCDAEKAKHPLKTWVCTSHCAAYGTKNKGIYLESILCLKGCLI